MTLSLEDAVVFDDDVDLAGPCKDPDIVVHVHGLLAVLQGSEVPFLALNVHEADFDGLNDLAGPLEV